jgi:DNA-binding beta-propeller fold protein YncE
MRHLTRALGLLLSAASGSAQVPGLTGTIIVTNKTPSTATVIDVASGRILATIPTGAGPHEITLSKDGRTAVVTDYSGQPGRTLTVIDVPAMKVVRTIELAANPRPHGIQFLPGDSLVAVTSEQSGHVVVLNPHAGDIRRAIPTEGLGSHMVGVTADGSRAYTGNMRSNTVSELDLRDGRFLRNLPVPTTPEAINVTPDGREVWVGSNQTGKLTVIDVASWSPSTAAESFRWPYRVLFTPDQKTVIVPDLTNEDVRFLDRATRRELGRISVPGAGPQGITSTPDGKYVLLSLSKQARVAVIDVASRSIIGYIAAGETPDGIVYTTRVYNK